MDGCLLGTLLGSSVTGFEVGYLDGLIEVGCLLVGSSVIGVVGRSVGEADGERDGFVVGFSVGRPEGLLLGRSLGRFVGCDDGYVVGFNVFNEFLC